MKRFSELGLCLFLLTFATVNYSSSEDRIKKIELQGETEKTLQGQELLHPKLFKRLTVVSGGQTGVDRAALDFALEYAVPCRGWCPKERWAEDGEIAAKYPLQETSSDLPKVRTEMNVIDSDGTLVLSWGNPTDGTKLTEDMAIKHNKPVLFISLEEKPNVQEFRKWIKDNNIRLLNIGGPRESFAPGKVYSRTMETLKVLLLK